MTANVYRQVRARIRKFGSPVWDGGVWWNRSTDIGWAPGRFTAIVEPAYDLNGVGLITAQM
ncbi:hypothetical protein, partial [Rhizobium sp. Root483D2]|uniref:hypothetical protein n=1 Tax=Rhizobium sp. Root483D2 TaxID=1736545 RepID=UPI00138EED7A